MAHWLLLVAADRVHATGAHLRSLLTLRPDNPITGTGVKGELTHGGASSRLGQGRTDVRHQLLDPVIGPPDPWADPRCAQTGTNVAASTRHWPSERTHRRV